MSTKLGKGAVCYITARTTAGKNVYVTCQVTKTHGDGKVTVKVTKGAVENKTVKVSPVPTPALGRYVSPRTPRPSRLVEVGDVLVGDVLTAISPSP